MTNGAGGKCLRIAALVGSGQLVLFGELRRLRIPADLWRSWLTDRGIIARFESKRSLVLRLCRRCARSRRWWPAASPRAASATTA